MRPARILSFLLVLAVAPLWADGAFPSLKVVPWNGHKAATSFTFDDSDPSHLDVAVPELDQRGMKGTFFLIANRTDRKDDWRKALAKGHELANHTLDHKHLSEMDAAGKEAQVVGANHVLQKEFGIPILTFAYPFVEIDADIKKDVEKTDLLARGGYGQTYEITPEMDVDWMNIPSRTTLTATPLSTYQEWISDDLKKGGWLVWMIHGLEGTPWGWEPISKKNFEGILDEVAKKDIWVGTFLEIGSYLRGQKIFESCKPQVDGGQETFSWTLPDLFPAHVLLKVRLAGDGKCTLSQGGKKIAPDGAGTYAIDLGQKSLRLGRN